MSAALNQSDSSYSNFNDGVVGSMTPAMVTQGQIVRNFGMQPPAYWLESQMSTPGPMTGGAPMLSPTQFSHGVMW